MANAKSHEEMAELMARVDKQRQDPSTPTIHSACKELGIDPQKYYHYRRRTREVTNGVHEEEPEPQRPRNEVRIAQLEVENKNLRERVDRLRETLREILCGNIEAKGLAHWLMEQGGL